MYKCFNVSKRKLSQKVFIPKIGAGAIPIEVSPLNAKKVDMDFLYDMKHMLRLIYKNYKTISLSIFDVLYHPVQI